MGIGPRDVTQRGDDDEAGPYKTVATSMEFIPADYEKRLVKNDFAWSAKNRDKIIAEWMKRYDAKSEPK